jgi:hypothetical protein
MCGIAEQGRWRLRRPDDTDVQFLVLPRLTPLRSVKLGHLVQNVSYVPGLYPKSGYPHPHPVFFVKILKTRELPNINPAKY